MTDHEELFHILLTGLNTDGTPYEPAGFSADPTQRSSSLPPAPDIGRTKDAEEVETDERTIDLTDMASVDAEDLVAHLAGANVLIGLFPVRGLITFKKEIFLKRATRKKWKKLKVGFLNVANNDQVEIVFAALLLIADSAIGPLQAATLRTMLASVQNARDT